MIGYVIKSLKNLNQYLKIQINSEQLQETWNDNEFKKKKFKFYYNMTAVKRIQETCDKIVIKPELRFKNIKILKILIRNMKGQ